MSCKVTTLIEQKTAELVAASVSPTTFYSKLNDFRKEVIRRKQEGINDVSDIIDTLSGYYDTLSNKQYKNAILECINLIKQIKYSTKNNIIKSRKIEHSTSTFIPLFDAKSNERISKEVSNNIFKTVIENAIGLIDSKEAFQKNIYTYKNKLFNQIVKFLQTQHSLTSQQVLSLNIYQNGELLQEKYVNVMQMFEQYLSSNFIEGQKLSDYQNNRQQYDAIIAFYILNNFDDVLQYTNSSIIEINEAFENSAEYILEKYQPKIDTLKRADWNDSPHANNADGETSNKMFKRWVNTITSPVTGIPLDDSNLSDIYKFCQAFYEQIDTDTNLAHKNLDSGITKHYPRFKELFSAFMNSKNENYQERLQALFTIYNNPSLRKFLPFSKESSYIIPALQTYLEKVNKIKNDNSKNSSQIVYVESTINMPMLFISSLDQHRNAAHTLTDATSRTQRTETISQHQQMKKEIYEPMLTRIAQQISEGNRLAFQKSTRITTTSRVGNISDLWGSSKVREFLESYYGLYWTDEQAYKFTTHSKQLTALNAVISKLADAALNILDRPEVVSYETAYTLMSDFYQQNLAWDPNWMDVSNELISEDHMNNMKMYDFNHNQMPNFQFENMSNTMAESIQEVKSNPAFADNIFVRQGSQVFNNKVIDRAKKANPWVQAQSNRFAVKIKDNQYGDAETISGQDLTVVEQIDLMFNEDFFVGICKNGVFTHQLNCNSDKKTIPLIHLNVMNTLKEWAINGKTIKGKTLIQLTPSELKSVYLQQLTTYIKTLENQLIESWKQHCKNSGFNWGTINTIDDVIQYTKWLRDNNVDVNTILSIFYKNGIKSVEEFTYYKADKKLYLNTELLYYIKDVTNGTTTLLDSSFSDYTKGLNTYQPKLNVGFNADPTKKVGSLMKNKEDLRQALKYSESNFNALTFEFPNAEDILLDLIQEQNKNALALSELKNLTITLKYTNNPTTDGEKLMNFLIEKQYLLGAIVVDGATQLEQKYSMMHKAKVPAKWEGSSLSELILDDKVKVEIHERYKTSTKRNNSNVATSIKLMLGLKYGVGKTFKAASMEDIQQVLHNTIGDSKNLDVVDGAAWTNGIYAVLENRSFPNKGISGSKKFIGFHREEGTLSQIKYADYEINNALLRTTSDDTRNGINMPIVFKKMNEQVFFNSASVVQVLGNILTKNKNLYLQKDKSYYTYSSISYGKAGIEITYTNAQGDTLVKNIPVNKKSQCNLYDIWQALGGAWCLSKNENGILLESNMSMELAADFCCDMVTDDTDPRTEMIGKILPKQVLKSGYSTPNPKAAWSDTKLPLQTFEIKSNSIGLQNDSTHKADGGQSANPTQAITNISFNGKELSLTTEAHDALAKIIELGMVEAAREMGIDKILESNNTDTKIYEFMTKKLLSSLQSGASISGATTMLESIVAGKFGNVSLPLSGREFIYKIISDLLSSMNTKAIKSKTNGGAFVYNPSQNVVTVWEDENGIPMTKKDILNKAIAEGYTGTPEEMINLYLYGDGNSIPSRMSPILVKDITDLNIGDKIQIDGQIYDLCQPLSTSDKEKKEGKYGFEDVVKALSTTQVFKIRHLGRDLQPFKYTWIDIEGKPHNIWSEEIICTNIRNKQSLEQAEEDYKKAKKSGNDLQKAEMALNLAKSNYQNSVLQVRQLLTRLKKGEGISNLRFKAGEQIIPKVNKTVQNLGEGTLYDILQLKEEYFKGRLELKYSPSDDQTINKIMASDGVYIVNESEEIIIQSITEDPNLIPEQLELIDGQQYAKIGNKYVPVPMGSKFYIDNSLGKPIYRIFTPDIQSVLQFGFSDSVIFTKNKLKKSIARNSKQIILTNAWKTELDNIISNQAKELYTSFILSNQSESLRIPTQSYQSFMAMETIAFMEGDTNDCYTNVWQSWFQGSDFDIDKNYTLLYNLNKNGTIATTTPFTSYQSKETLEASLDLPLPNKTLANSVFFRDWTKDDADNYQKIYELLPDVNDDEDITDKWDEVINNNPDNALLLYNELNKLLRSNPTSLPGSLFELYITHHQYKASKKGYQNKLVRNIFKASSSIINMEYSVQPMSADPTREAYEQVKNEYAVSEDTMLYTSNNPLSKFVMQELNAVGKVQVGIYANGIKVVGTLQEYFNKYYKQVAEYGKPDPNKDFYLPELTFTVSAGEPPLSIGPFVTFGNFYVEKGINQLMEHIQITQNLDDATMELIKQRISQEENIADKLSIMISLATDNAKELLLGNIKSTAETGNLFIALYSLGVPTKDILKISVKVLGPIVESFKNENRLRSHKTKKDLLSAIKHSTLDDTTKSSLTALYYYGQELTGLASFFGINQGISARWVELENIERKINYALQKQKSNIKWDAAKDTIVKTKSGREITIEVFQHIVTQPLDIQAFTEDLYIPIMGDEVSYRQLMIAYYNSGKKVINILDVIASTPHFFNMYRVLAYTLGTTRKIMSRVGYIEYVNQNPEGNRVGSTEDLSIFSEGEENQDEEGTPTKVKQSMLSDKINIYDHFIIGETLKKLPKYTFTVGDLYQNLKNQYGIEMPSLLQYPSNFQINLSSDIGTKLFVEIMNNLIPVLQSKYPSNGFIKELSKGQSGYDLRFSFFDTNSDTQTAMIRAQEIETGFNGIKDLNSQITNNVGEGLVFGELFYLYNMIAHKNKIGRLNKFVTMMSESYGNPIFTEYIKTINDLDNKYINRMKELELRKKQDSSFNIWSPENWSDFPFELLKNLSYISNSDNPIGEYDGNTYNLANSQINIFPDESSNYANNTLENVEQLGFEVSERITDKNKRTVLIPTLSGTKEIEITGNNIGEKFIIDSKSYYSLILASDKLKLDVNSKLKQIYGSKIVIEDRSYDAILAKMDGPYLDFYNNIKSKLQESNVSIKIISSGDPNLMQVSTVSGTPTIILSKKALQNIQNSNNIAFVNTLLNAITNYGDLEEKIEIIQNLIPNFGDIINPLKKYLEDKAYLTANHINQQLKEVVTKYHKKLTKDRQVYYNSVPHTYTWQNIYKHDIIEYTRPSDHQKVVGLYLGELNNEKLIYNITTQNIEVVENPTMISNISVYTQIVPLDLNLFVDTSDWNIPASAKMKDYELGKTVLNQGDYLKIKDKKYWITQIFVDDSKQYKYICQDTTTNETIVLSPSQLDTQKGPIKYGHTQNIVISDENIKDLVTIQIHPALPNINQILKQVQKLDKVLVKINGELKEGIIIADNPRTTLQIQLSDDSVTSVSLDQVQSITFRQATKIKRVISLDKELAVLNSILGQNKELDISKLSINRYTIDKDVYDANTEIILRSLKEGDLLLEQKPHTSEITAYKVLSILENNLYIINSNTQAIEKIDLNNINYDVKNRFVSVAVNDYNQASELNHKATSLEKVQDSDTLFLESLSSAFGNIPVRFVDSNNVPGNIKGWTDGATIYLVKTDGKSYCKETAIHELAHIVLAYIRTNNPELYFNMIKDQQGNTTEEKEEFIVSQFASGNSRVTNTSQLKMAIVNWCKNIFGSTNVDLNKNIQSLINLKTKSIGKHKDAMMHSLKWVSWMDNITYDC